jgi:hypothetical protein
VDDWPTRSPLAYRIGLPAVLASVLPMPLNSTGLKGVSWGRAATDHGRAAPTAAATSGDRRRDQAIMRIWFSDDRNVGERSGAAAW